MNQQRSRGFTLVEALIALLVLSIGLLGVAGLQLAALRQNNSASQRSQATFLAYDIIDRMRANRRNALDVAAPAYVVGYGTHTATGTLAERDLTAWKAGLAAVLPAGDGQIARDADPNLNRWTISIRWDDSRGEEAALVFVTETQI